MSNKLNLKTNPGQLIVYQIRIKGHLGRQWTDWFEGLIITLEDNGETLLTGPVVDQAALRGLLTKVWDLNLTLLSVTRVKSKNRKEQDRMSDMIKSFNELTAEQQSRAGGKGGVLARLYQAGYPVPNGFVSLPSAFAGDALTAEAWTQVQAHLNHLRGTEGKTTFAVRSSAMSEDSAQASFTGEFETGLNVQTDQEIRKAIHTVYHSRQSERVQAYSQARGMMPTQAGGWHEVAVIVQLLVPAESSGVLFTANLATGQRNQAMISASWGLGEAIVGGW